MFYKALQFCTVWFPPSLCWFQFTSIRDFKLACGKVIHHNEHLNCICFFLKVTLPLCGNADESRDWIEKSGSEVHSWSLCYSVLILCVYVLWLKSDWHIRISVHLCLYLHYWNLLTLVAFSELLRFNMYCTVRVFFILNQLSSTTSAWDNFSLQH